MIGFSSGLTVQIFLAKGSGAEDWKGGGNRVGTGDVHARIISQGLSGGTTSLVIEDA